MSREEVHRCWAPAGDSWSAWVKPVLFANLDDAVEVSAPPPSDWLRRCVIDPLWAPSEGAPHPYRRDPSLRDTALVIDLPGEAGTWLGVACAGDGFRPIPLYNAVPAFVSVVELRRIMGVLVAARERVAAVAPGAPPAFLLDGNRMGGAKISLIPPSVGMFDNRSVCSESDFPSAERLWQAGIRRAVLIQERRARPAIDLEPVLFGWQQRGIALSVKRSDDDAALTRLTLRRLGWLSRFGQWLRRQELKRRPDGAYGRTQSG